MIKDFKNTDSLLFWKLHYVDLASSGIEKGAGNFKVDWKQIIVFKCLFWRRHNNQGKLSFSFGLQTLCNKKLREL